MSRRWPVLVLLLALLCAGAYFFLLPRMAQSAVEKSFHQAGFEEFSYDKAERSAGSVSFHKVKFDPDAFSHVDVITASYDMAGLLFHGRLTKLEFENPSLMGEVDKQGKVTVAGWKNIAPLPASINTITINGGKISLMSESIGGISFNLDGQFRHHSDGGTAFQGVVSGEQKQLSINTSINANIRASGIWQADLDIKEARIDIAPLKASRINGKATLKGEKFRIAHFSSQLQAGAVNYDGLPWQGMAMAIEGNPEKFGLSANAASIGVDGLYLEIRLIYSKVLQDLDCRIRMVSLDTLRDYLRKHEYLTKEPSVPSKAKAELVMTKVIGSRYGYEIKDDTGLIIRKGQVDLVPGKALKDNMKSMLAELED